MVALSDPLLAQLAERLASRDVSALEPLPGGASSLTYVGQVCGSAGGRQGGAARGAADRAPRRLAASPHHPDARCDAGTRPGGAVRGSGRPARRAAAIRDVPRGRDDAASRCSTATTVDPKAVVAERFRNAAATMAQLHRIEPGAVGLGSEPAIGPSAEVERWCRTLETVDAALVPGWREVAAALESSTPPSPAGRDRARRLSARQPAGCRRPHHRRHRLGDLVGRRPARRRRMVLDQLRPERPTAAPRGTLDRTPPLSELAAVYRAQLGREVPELDWFQALACFKSTATWSLIVKHNRRRSAPDPGLEAMAAVLPQLLSRARELLG